MLVIIALLCLLVAMVGVPAFRYLWWPLALALSAAVPPVLLLGASWLYAGHLDPFWPMTLAVSGSVALLAAAVVGLVVTQRARRP